MVKIFFYICIFFILANCSNKTTYSGKILNNEELKEINFTNKEKLISKLGKPSYIDPIENKFFYFSEVSEKKSILKKKIKYSYVFVFKIDEYNQIVESKVYNTKNIESIKFSDDKTYNEIAAKSNNATMFVILIIGLTAGPAVSL